MIRLMEKALNFMKNMIFIIAAVILASYGIIMCLGIKPAVIVSGSMEPAIKTGSLVFIDTKCEEASERDIIAFRSGNIYVTHRVESVTDEGYVTKGDANELADPGILKRKDLEGRVVMWVPYLGYAIKFMSSLPVLIICVMLILVAALMQVAAGKEEANGQDKNSDGSCDAPS